jgi:hypothetical protein
MIDWDWWQLQRHWFDRRAQLLLVFLSQLRLLPVALNFEYGVLSTYQITRA